ncbi:MAG: hypothetical protein ABH856_04855 [Patescibacteria group bacterium]|nr:hypothetical protein [Patescibacteria group bacterium]
MEKVMKSTDCANCGSTFDITDWDLSFYAKMNVPEPTHCPDCRRQRRMAQINQINLFQRKCSVTGENIISNYPEESPYKVYKQEYWHGEKYDGKEFGRDFDFNRPFFEQYNELNLATPRAALFTHFWRDENSEYTNFAGMNKNCYLIFDSDEDWDCYYSYGMNHSKNCSDCYRVQFLELCYEAVDSKNCVNCNFTYNSENCAESWFLNNCIGCKYCVMCSNLRRKDYCYKNEPVSKERYAEILAEMKSYENLELMKKEFAEYRLKFPQKYMRGMQNENCTGNNLVHSKNAFNCFDSMYIWDGKYCSQVFIKAKDIMDSDEVGVAELNYDSNNLAYNCYNMRFSYMCMEQIRDMDYCNWCFHCGNLFGCVGLKRVQYCILNKQYTKEGYEEMVPRIIEHMKKTPATAGQTGEWGEYFPIKDSSFPYNLTMAQEHFPLTKEEALAKGYKWRDPDKKEYRPQKYQIPDNIGDVPDSIVDELLACAGCGKNYKIVPAELKFLKEKGIPIPRKCFHCRHADRFKPRPPRKLWDRKCDKCGVDISTAYPPERPEEVYCEKCYIDSLG